ncbi:dolichol-phosphate mannosyltransferase subunit 3-like [Saccoglossus kowalevskii]|uniref:Dolichol-phosphate mannosyltransferase subunit 3 n=1 Tax=Saccoglossus kowalevskii TaxID=10224 RepID=A0ABM0MVY9_SACKO|nr:PREDICTED: dolichol-phosphate mannosyltransferase subunit 3-like [Saccoglossus kowalevskii]
MATKLVQWLTGLSLFFSVWASIVFDLVPVSFDQRIYQVVLPLPIYLVIAFGCYALAVVGYRTATFNDCVEAAEELKEEIMQAKADLKKKGLKMS